MQQRKVGPLGSAKHKVDGAEFDVETMRPRWGLHVRRLRHERYADLVMFLHDPLARTAVDGGFEQLVMMSGLACDYADGEHRFNFYLNIRHEVRGATFTEEGRAKLSKILGIDLHWPEVESATRVA